MWVPSDFHCPQRLQVPLQLRELDRGPLQVGQRRSNILLRAQRVIAVSKLVEINDK